MSDRGNTDSFPFPPPPPPPPDPLQDLPPRPFWASTESFRRGFGVPPGSGVDHAAGDGPERRFSHGFTFGPGGFNAWFGPRGFDGSWGGRGRWGGGGGGGPGGGGGGGNGGGGGGGGGGGRGGGGGFGYHPPGGRRRRGDPNTAAQDGADDGADDVDDTANWSWSWGFPGESGRDGHLGTGGRPDRFGRRAGAGEQWGFGGNGFGGNGFGGNGFGGTGAGAGRRHWGGHRASEYDDLMGDAPTAATTTAAAPAAAAAAAAAATTSPVHDESSDTDTDTDTDTTVDHGAGPHTPATTDRPATPSTTADFPDPPEEEPVDASRPRGEPGSRGHHGHRRGHHRGGHGARGHVWRGPRAGFGRRSRDHPDGSVPPASPPPPGGPGGPEFDINAMMSSLGLEHLQEYVNGLERDIHRLRGSYAPGASQDRRGRHGRGSGPRSGGVRGGPAFYHDGADADAERGGEDQAFVPPVDIFNHATNWTVHLALPGAKKEDIAVNWDAGRSDLAISGIVHRPGDEEFLRGLVAGERRVGLFERRVRLPPNVEEKRDEKAEGPEGDKATTSTKDEVDADGITARMEDGVLIVVVPKIEKEWTQVRKVDIQ